MAKQTKNTKKAATTQGKPITDFFTPASKPHPQPGPNSKMRRVSSSVPSQESSSEDIKPTTSTSKTTGVLSNSKVASIVSTPPTESSSKVYGRDVSERSLSTKTSLSKPAFASSSAISSRSPDFQAHPRASTPLNSKKALSDTVKISNRRKNKRDSVSDIEMANATVDSTVCHSPTPQWGTYSVIFLAQSEKSQESSSFTS